MLLMRGATADLKDMAEPVDSVARSMSTTTTSAVHVATNMKKPTITTVTGKNNNKTNVAFKSQSPSEDKAIRYGGLPCETDHMYANYAGDSGKYRELANEVAHLKALVLFHLDLIQQQSECNAAKDKQLSALKQENDMLRQRLERMERRVQLQSSKHKCDGVADEPVSSGKHNETPAQPPVPVACNESEDIKPRVPAGTLPVPEPPAASPTEAVKSEETSRKRIKTLLPVRTKSSPSPPVKRRKSVRGAETEDAIDKGQQASYEENLDDLINQAVKEGTILSVSDSCVPSERLLEAKVVLEPCPLIATVTLPKAKNSKKPGHEEPVNVLNLPVHPDHRWIREALLQKQPPREPAHLKKDAILTTESHFPTLLGETANQVDLVIHENHVEVPQWVIKPLCGRSSAQGIENLDDEVFTKRHLKHEMDEKRRKRWDLQRIREQRRYEKLRARYEGEDRCQDRVRSHHHAPTDGAGVSLWPSPEDVTHVQVEAWLPVSAFGSPLPNLARADFRLPWSQSSDEPPTTAKRRQRRCQKTE